MGRLNIKRIQDGRMSISANQTISIYINSDKFRFWFLDLKYRFSRLLNEKDMFALNEKYFTSNLYTKTL